MQHRSVRCYHGVGSGGMLQHQHRVLHRVRPREREEGAGATHPVPVITVTVPAWQARPTLLTPGMQSALKATSPLLFLCCVAAGDWFHTGWPLDIHPR